MAERIAKSSSTKDKVDELQGENQILCFNKELIPCKLMFFVTEAAFASAMSFLTIFYVSSGLTPAQVGVSFGIGSGFMLLAGPLWGAIVDTSRHKIALVVFLVLGTTFVEFSKPFTVMYVSKMTTNVTCLGNITRGNSSNQVTGTNCKFSVSVSNINDLFLAIIINSILTGIFISGLVCFIEGAVCKTVFTRKTVTSYGEQKVFAPVGAAVGSFLAGVAIDHYRPEHLSKYAAAFYVFLPFSLMMLPCLCILAKQAKWDYAKKKDDVPLKKRLMEVFSNCNNIIFFISVFLLGIAANINTGFLFLFMRDTMDPTKTIMSVATVVARASELLIYPFSSRIIRLLGGCIPCVIIGVISYTARLLLLSYCTQTWHVLSVQLFEGICVSLAWTAQIQYTYDIFPKEVTTTAVAAVWAIHFVLSGVLSQIVGGVLYTRYGGAVLFRGASVMNALWGIIMICYFGVQYKRSGCIQTSPAETGRVHEIELEEQPSNNK